MGAPIVHFEIMGGEGSQLETFYRDVFGRKINSKNAMKYGIIKTGGGPGGTDGSASCCSSPLSRPQAAPTQINVVLNWFEELKQRVPTGKK